MRQRWYIIIATSTSNTTMKAVTQAAAVGWTLAGANSYANDAYQFFVIGQKGATDIATITALLDAAAFIMYHKEKARLL